MTSITTTISKTGKKIQTVPSPVTTPPIQRKALEPTVTMSEKSEKQTIQEMLQNIQESLTKNREEAVKNYEDLKGDLGEVKKDIKSMGEKFEKMQETVKKNEEKIQVMENKITSTEGRIGKMEVSHLQVTKELEEEIILLEMEKSAFYLRFQNVIEEKDEKLEEVMAEIIAESLKRSKEEIARDIDETFRLQTNYARRHNLPREVHVRFSKKALREEVYKQAREEQLSYKGKQIITLRQIPKRVRELRNEYQFLTSELRKNDIWYKWLLPDGISITWQEKKIRLENVQEAQDFYEQHFTIIDEQETQETEEEGEVKSQEMIEEGAGGIRRREREERVLSQRELRHLRRNRIRYRQ